MACKHRKGVSTAEAEEMLQLEHEGVTRHRPKERKTLAGYQSCLTVRSEPATSSSQGQGGSPEAGDTHCLYFSSTQRLPIVLDAVHTPSEPVNTSLPQRAQDPD